MSDYGHWHVALHSEDYDPLITPDLYAAIDYAGTELRQLEDMELAAIRSYGEAGQFEEAYRCWDHAQTYGDLAANAENIWRQASSEPKDRAPLYQDDAPYTPSGAVNMLSKLHKSARWVRDKIEADSPISFWWCPAETGEDRDGIPCCKAEE